MNFLVQILSGEAGFGFADIRIPLFQVSIAILLLSGVSSFVPLFKGIFLRTAPCVGVFLASAILLPLSLFILFGAPPLDFSFQGAFPYGAYSVRVDPLSSWFLIMTLLLSMASSLFGIGYFGRKIAPLYSFLFNLMITAIIMVLCSSDAILFLFSWEIMALASYFLVVYNHEREDVRRAGFVYLAATHLGALFIFAFFAILCAGTSSTDFSMWKAAVSASSAFGSLAFILALIGFGAKAGSVPFHVWLPHAYPAAESPVSVLMSGIMIKTGVYGFLRSISFFDRIEAWHGWLLLVIGALGAILGIAFAIKQSDMKRLLAYSSAENVGIIFSGIGLAFIFSSFGSDALAAVCLCGALLHAFNHSLIKGLLFFASGVVFHFCGPVSMNRLGGLMKRAPFTAACALAGAFSICALPPFNGFIGEFVILYSSLSAIASKSPLAYPALIALVGTALATGFAAACFLKLFSITFLGQPRSVDAEKMRDPSFLMLAPMAGTAFLCVILGLFSFELFDMSISPSLQILGLSSGSANGFKKMSETLGHVSLAGFALGLLIVVVAIFRGLVLLGKKLGKTPTWDCGFSKPAPRMQYSSSSFAQPITSLFGNFLDKKGERPAVRGFFPKTGQKMEIKREDFFERKIFAPLFTGISGFMSRFRWIQHGKVQLYILYIAVALILLLIWGLA